MLRPVTQRTARTLFVVLTAIVVLFCTPGSARAAAFDVSDTSWEGCSELLDIARAELGNELGFIPTDKHSLAAKGVERVFVIGDATDVPASKAGSVAHFEAETLVENLQREDLNPIEEAEAYREKIQAFLQKAKPLDSAYAALGIHDRIRIESAPPGIPILVDGELRATPAMIESLIGFEHMLEAPADFGDWHFHDWSNGGSRQQVYVAPERGVVLRAFYTH